MTEKGLTSKFVKQLVIGVKGWAAATTTPISTEGRTRPRHRHDVMALTNRHHDVRRKHARNEEFDPQQLLMAVRWVLRLVRVYWYQNVYVKNCTKNKPRQHGLHDSVHTGGLRNNCRSYKVRFAVPGTHAVDGFVNACDIEINWFRHSSFLEALV